MAQSPADNLPKDRQEKQRNLLHYGLFYLAQKKLVVRGLWKHHKNAVKNLNANLLGHRRADDYVPRYRWPLCEKYKMKIS